MSPDSMFMKLNPAVPRRILELTVGALWIVGGLILILRAGLMIETLNAYQWAVLAVGVALGALKARFVLFHVAKKSIERIRKIAPDKDRLCFFAFIPRTTYFLIALMITLGLVLRSAYPHSVYVAALYDGFGLALVISGLRALRYVRRQVS